MTRELRQDSHRPGWTGFDGFKSQLSSGLRVAAGSAKIVPRFLLFISIRLAIFEAASKPCWVWRAGYGSADIIKAS